MSDLISRKQFIKEIELSMVNNPHTEEKVKANHNLEHQHFMHMALRQPTAYDVDKVIEQLEYENTKCKDVDGMLLPVIDIDDAIKIVKGGIK